MKSVMLYLGSFNPIHKGHIAIAERVLKDGLSDEVWLVVSPQNPLKPQDLLINERHRLRMVELAIENSGFSLNIKACDEEFSLPRPSYTIDTLTHLTEKYPDIQFSLLVGSDIVEQIEKWKDWQTLLNKYKIYVYPRRCYEHNDRNGKFTLIKGVPYEDYSSTDVRCALSEAGASDMITKEIKDYIKKYKLWTDTNRK